MVSEKFSRKISKTRGNLLIGWNYLLAIPLLWITLLIKTQAGLQYLVQWLTDLHAFFI